jgi:hypothetical protein
MKNLFIVIALIFSASILIISCSKIETPGVSGKVTSGSQVAEKSSGNSHGNGLKSANTFGTNWVFDDEEVKCWPSPLDCYDPVPVRASLDEIIKLFEFAVNGNKQDVKYFFTTQNWQSLFPGLEGTDNLIKLQSGNYDMIMSTGSNNMVHYLAGSTLPLTLHNEEFVLRIDKSVN